MFQQCQTMTCPKFKTFCGQEVCTVCLLPTACAAHSVQTASNLLPDSTVGCGSAPPMFHMDSLFNEITDPSTAAPYPMTFSGIDVRESGTSYDAFSRLPMIDLSWSPVVEDSNEPLPHVSRQNFVPASKLPASLQIHQYEPQAENPGKEKTEKGCISCYNKRKCLPKEGQTCCEYCFSKSIYCRGPINIPPLMASESWSCAAAANTPRPHDATILGATNFTLLLERDDSVQDSATYKPYNINIQSLRDNVAITEGSTDFNAVLDMILPDTDGQKSNWRWTQKGVRTPVDCHCRRFRACIIPLLSPGSCKVGSELRKHHAKFYITLEFLRQLSHQAGTLFIKIFEGLETFLASTRDKTQIGRQKSSIAFQLGQVYRGVDSFGNGQEMWSYLLRRAKPYMIAPEALSQLKLFGHSFDKKRFAEGCDDDMNLPTILITLASAQGDSMNQIADERCSLIEVLKPCTTQLDEEVANESSKLDPLQGQQIPELEIRAELSSSQNRRFEEKRADEVRASELIKADATKPKHINSLDPANGFSSWGPEDSIYCDESAYDVDSKRKRQSGHTSLKKQCIGGNPITKHRRDGAMDITPPINPKERGRNLADPLRGRSNAHTL